MEKKKTISIYRELEDILATLVVKESQVHAVMEPIAGVYSRKYNTLAEKVTAMSTLKLLCESMASAAAVAQELISDIKQEEEMLQDEL